MPSRERTISSEHLPGLYRSADAASLSAQARYLRLVQVDMILVIIAAVAGSFSMTDATLQKRLVIGSAVIFILSLVASLVLAIRRLDRLRYAGRAVAESVKTLAWRYAMGAEPYGTSQDAATVDSRFVAALKAVLDERRYLAIPLVAGAETSATQITDRMRQVRARPVTDRLRIYVTDRIEEQRDWYAAKARSNSRLEGRWFSAVIASQAVAAISAIALMWNPAFAINGTGLFSALAASFAAWMQTKRFQELSQSYAVAAHELGMIRDRASGVATEAALSSFVNDAETAMSREHTLWTARRET
jgi:hypothetical protein